MSQGHSYYQPTEYETMLIVAGWITPESVDADYQAYVQRDSDWMDYGAWLATKREWDALNAAYQAEIEPYYTGMLKDEPMPYRIKERQNELLRDMNWCEVSLGY